MPVRLFRARPLTVALAALCLGTLAAPGVAWADPGGSSIDPDEARFRALFAKWKHQGANQHRPARPAWRLMIARPPAHVANVVVTSGVGMRMNPVLGRTMFHAGADLAAATGSPVRATADGGVARAGWAGGYGLLVTVRHGNGYETRYGHLSRVLVTPGEPVRRGQLLGYVGSTGRSTGPHLHYEIRRDGAVLDPLPYMKR